jgi:hypothetical protein
MASVSIGDQAGIEASGNGCGFEQHDRGRGVRHRELHGGCFPMKMIPDNIKRDILAYGAENIVSIYRKS